jgi:aspartate/methionine/tyrosine aminotransferase
LSAGFLCYAERPSVLNAKLGAMTDYPFSRLAGLLGKPTSPDGRPTINLALGEPQSPPPPIIAETLARHAADWGRYPPITGTPAFRAAVSAWLSRRYGLSEGAVDPDAAILPVQGTREALFQIAQVCVDRETARNPAVLVPSPSYATYAAAGHLAGAEIVPMPGRAESGFLPELDRLPPTLLERTRLLYLCTPSNPEGAVAGIAYLRRAIGLARRYGFVLAVDECYSEIWDSAPPPGAFEAAMGLDREGDDPFANIVIFNSLSKRSSAAGLRSGFIAGDRRVIALMQRLRTYASSAPPLPVLAASAALWSDEAHVFENRAAYRRNLDLAEAALGGIAGFYRPAGGFFLWLDVGNGEAAALRLWRDHAIRTLPGAYLARLDGDGKNPGERYIRLALVHDSASLAPALARIAETLRRESIP